jgi:tetratricopeptide (TPR) repeat protein
MVAGSPPYQAQDTRKLEELIQSRRPPRALPDACPSALRAILHKALAGDLHLRYVSAAAFESDVRMFLEGRTTVAQSERRNAWRSSPTIEKPRFHVPERVSSMAETVKQRVMRLKPARAQRLASALSILSALFWGLLAGLVVCVPAGYYYRFWRESGPLRGATDYTQASLAGINEHWNLFGRIQRQNAFLGGLSPAAKLSVGMRSRLLEAADAVIDGYRSSSDPAIEHFDWAKAAACLEHALEMDASDRIARGKLALATGYASLARGHAPAAEANFQEARTLMPRSPDPHLGLARIRIYSEKNVAKAVAELHAAEQLGFRAGPRELEQEADGYRFRAAAELSEARKYRGKSRAAEERYLRLAQRDYGRARELYEPLMGYSNASVALRQVDDDDRTREQLNEALAKPARPQRRTVRRASRWQ